ncbi:MAG TPA: GvpL/GvpF family gas vesicle protein [Vicinamibacterales bacterium]|jgi:hypothetical protein
MPQTAIYIYCLVEQTRQPSLARVSVGVPGATAPVILPVGKSLWAVAAEVPLATYGSDRLEERLKDVNWVADAAVAHEAIVERFASARGAAVVPMKLFTMFSTRERAVADLRGKIRDVGAILKRIRGCQEWGVRVTRRAPDPSARERSASKPSTGTAFLSAKMRARDDARAAIVKAADAAEAAYRALERLARAARRREAPEGATTPPLVDAAFLVRADRKARFRAAARRSASNCRKAGADFALTGPWPAYNFVERA